MRGHPGNATVPPVTPRWYQKGAFAALEHRNFRLFWLGQTVSLTGTQMQRVAVAWHVYALTGSAVALGGLGIARLLPVLLFALPGGVLADRVDRKQMMLWSTVVQAVASAVLCVASWTGVVDPTILYLCVAVGAGASAINAPARQALVPNLVPPASLQPALTISLLAWDVAGVGGPALGGVVLAWAGAGAIYLFDALSYGAVALAISRMGPVPGPSGAPPASALAATWEGLRFVFGHRLLRVTMLLDFVATLFGQATVLFPVFAAEVLHVGTSELGLLFAAPALGSVVVGLVLASLPPIRRAGLGILLSITVYGVATVVFGLSTWLPLTLVALMMVGASDTVSTMLRQVLRQRSTPDGMRGRMTGVNMLFFQGGPQLGEFESGLATAWLGASMAVAGGGVGVLLTVVAVLVLVPALRSYVDDADAA